MQEKNNKFIIAYIIIGILGRLIPHPANVTPLNSLCLFAGSKLSRLMAIITMLLCILISDLGLAYLKGYPLFGSWTFFTYSGFAVIVLLGAGLGKKFSNLKLVMYVVGSSLGFWLWTNLGSWLMTPYYIKDMQGLITCYTAALPFLRNALFGDLVWMVVIFGLYRIRIPFKMFLVANWSNKNG